LFEKILVPKCPPVFSVGDAPQTHVLLQLNSLQYRVVLDGAQFRSVYLAALVLVAGGQ
jgi:hypothetical protein